MTTPGSPSVTHLPFQAEVNQLLSLVINSLYTNKEIFLRELISNASDALDKLRFAAVTRPELLDSEPKLEIRITARAAETKLVIEDTGIGMSRDELIKNLGTIAHSGSREFVEKLGADKAKDLSLIGQFGVGFYSAYLVADRVEVTSKAAGANEAWRWSSDAKNEFTVEPADRSARGTQIVLHLRKDQSEFLEQWRLKDLIGKYSDYVNHPILLWETPPPAPEEKPAEAVVIEGSFQVANQASALWQRSKGDITDTQYDEFYKHLSRDFTSPLARIHFKAEGTQQFAGLLFVPKFQPYDLNSPDRAGIRLYVKRVFIMDHCDALLPQWLRFVRGVVDSDDLPLNVSREVLQDSALVRGIKKQVTKKAVEMLTKLAKDKPEDYRAFWESFGGILKEGVALDDERKDDLAPLLRFQTSHSEALTSLPDYVSRMPDGQPAIYYAFGESKAALADSPHLEGLRKRGYEVLFMTDPVDEWATQRLHEFQGKKLVSAMHADLKLGVEDEKKSDTEGDLGGLKPLVERMRELLGEKVRDVRTSARLTDSPCCLVLPEGGTHAFMERLLQEKGRALPRSKRIFEINPTHPLIIALRDLHARDAKAERITESIELLYDQAVLTEGSRVDNPALFARRMTALLAQVTSSALQRGA